MELEFFEVAEDVKEWTNGKCEVLRISRDSNRYAASQLVRYRKQRRYARDFCLQVTGAPCERVGGGFKPCCTFTFFKVCVHVQKNTTFCRQKLLHINSLDYVHAELNFRTFISKEILAAWKTTVVIYFRVKGFSPTKSADWRVVYCCWFHFVYSQHVTFSTFSFSFLTAT